jgi:hypothetical protein
MESSRPENLVQQHRHENGTKVLALLGHSHTGFRGGEFCAGGNLKTLIPLVVLIVASGLIGLVVCITLLFFKRYWIALVSALVFFGGPIALSVGIYIKAVLDRDEFEAARKVVNELCAKHGGDKIYKTVENVEGVFQMRARTNWSGDQSWGDQYGMFDPWGAAQGDETEPVIELNCKGDGYWFVEQPSGREPGAPPYRRRTYVKREKVDIHHLRSRYGYITQDLSTPQMRKRWIAGGRIKVIDLQTNEVLAERVGYFLTSGRDWLPRAAFQNGRICPDSHLGAFLRQVLKPIQVPPSAEQQAALVKD